MTLEQKRECLNDFLKLWQSYWERVYPYLTFDADHPPPLSQNVEEDFLRMKSEALKAFPKVEEICWSPKLGPDLVTSFNKAMEASNSLYDLAMSNYNRDQLRKTWGAVHSGLNLALGNLDQEEAHARSFPYRLRRLTVFIAGGSPAMWLIRLVVLALAAWKLGDLVRPLFIGGKP